jgi:acetoin utilization protein AcuB
MQIRDWMTTDVITASLETSLMKISKVMKECCIRRVPVVDANRKVIGIVSDRDVKDASPSKATTLDVYELYYLLSEIKARDIMTPNPITVNVKDTVEQVALLMQERSVGGLPVVEDDGTLAGIITEHDVFKVLAEITGVRHGGVQFAIAVEDLPGSVRPIIDLLRTHNASLISLLTANSKTDNRFREIFLRVRPMERSEENRLIDAVSEQFNVLYWVRDSVREV